MARSVADLEFMARVLFGERGEREDCLPAPVPYRDVTLPEKLRFGYYLNGASGATWIRAGLIRTYIKQTDCSRDPLPATEPCWTPWRHFVRQDMNASKSTLQIVRDEAALRLMESLSSSSSYPRNVALDGTQYRRGV
jgi:hypothetical protein